MAKELSKLQVAHELEREIQQAQREIKQARQWGDNDLLHQNSGYEQGLSYAKSLVDRLR